MIQENEAITLLLALGMLLFLRTNRTRLHHLPAPKTLLAAFYLLVAGWILTIVEGFFWHEALNLVEHLCYAGSATLLAAWCWQAFARQGEEP
jgi:hypothetical protein